MQKLCSILAGISLLCGTLSAQPELDGTVNRLIAAQRVWDGPGMEAARSGFAALARRAPGEYGPLYWQSVSEFYLTLYYGLEDSGGYDPARAKALLEPAEKTMKAAIAARPDEAECRAMLSSVYGFCILFNPLSAVWNGSRVLSLQHDALENDPDNPRALYIIGAGYFRAPTLFRNVGKARGFLEKAEGLFRRLPADAPPWGRAECVGLLGDLLHGEGELSAAHERYLEALRINPAYAPAQRALKEMENEK